MGSIQSCRKSFASSWKHHRTLQVVKSRSLHSLKYYHPWWYIYRGDLMPEFFSVNEAAAIAEVSPETIRTALEKKSVKPSHKKKTGRAVRHQFSIGDVLFVKLLVEFPFP